MGCCSSRNSSPSSSVLSSARVVHLNGWVEDFDYPVSVSQLIGRPPKYFVFTAAQLLSTGLKPLKPDTLLERGHLYFLVPSSTFQADISPADLATIVKRLTAKAKSRKVEAKSPGGGSSPSSLSPVLETNCIIRGSRKEPWRPILDTIRERSFNRSSESDLQELNSGDQEKGQF